MSHAFLQNVDYSMDWNVTLLFCWQLIFWSFFHQVGYSTLLMLTCFNKIGVIIWHYFLGKPSTTCHLKKGINLTVWLDFFFLGQALIFFHEVLLLQWFISWVSTFVISSANNSPLSWCSFNDWVLYKNLFTFYQLLLLVSSMLNNIFGQGAIHYVE